MDGASFNNGLLDTLAGSDGPAAERALFQALEVAQDALQAAVVAALLGRPGVSAKARLAKLLPILDVQSRRVLQKNPAALETVARLGLDEPDASTRLNVVTLLDDAQAPSCAYLLASAVSDPVALVRALAARALCKLVGQCIEAETDLGEYIAPAVSQAMRSFPSHQSPDVLTAAVSLGFHCPRDVLKFMDRPGNRMSDPLEAVLGEMPADRCAQFVLSALRFKLVGGVAGTYICRATWSALATIARHEHYLALAGVGKALRQIQHLRAVTDDPAGLCDLPSADQPRALRLVMACGLDPRSVDAMLGLALAGEEATANAALPYVLDTGRNATELVLMALHSRHRGVQSVAAARIIAGGADANLTEHLLQSLPALSEPVRAVVSQFVATTGFEKYWKSFRRLDGAVRSRAGRALLKLDSRVADLVAARLISRDPAQQLQATQMVRQMGMGLQFENSLCQLARHGDKIVRSAAVAALTDVDTFVAHSTLAKCLHDADARVQANAIEALAAAGTDPSAVLDKVDSHNNRVRANAIRLLIERAHDRADMALAAMLTDGRTRHRISALWVVDSLNHTSAGAILSRLSAADPDAKVRARATTILRRLKVAKPEEVAV